jgi:hypothetical protein
MCIYDSCSTDARISVFRVSSPTKMQSWFETIRQNVGYLDQTWRSHNASWNFASDWWVLFICFRESSVAKNHTFCLDSFCNTRYSLVVAKASTERTWPNDTEMRSRVLCQGSLRATLPVLSMWPCKLKLDEDMSKHASLAQWIGFGPAFLHSLLRLVKGTAKPNTCQRKV